MGSPERQDRDRIPVLHVVNEVTDCSISSIIAFIVEHLGSQRFTWHICAVNELGNMAQSFRDLGVHVVDFTSTPGLSKGGVHHRMRAYIRRHHIAIVHTHTLRARLIAAVALWGTKGSYHVDTVHHLYKPVDGRGGAFRTLIDRVSYYIPDHLIAVSDKMSGEISAMPLLASGNGDRHDGVAPSGKVTAIQNAIDCGLFYSPDVRVSCRAEFGFSADTPVIGYTGQILALKRLDVLLAAFAQVLAQYPRARLLIVGNGDQRQVLEEKARTLGVGDAVTWTGFRQDIPRLLSAMDIFVLPSSNEGMSLSILEAMAAGLAVVVTDVGGAREVVADGETGIVIPPGSVPAVSEAVLGLLADAGLRERLGDAARRTICTKFGVTKMAAAYGEVYAKCVNRNHWFRSMTSDSRGKRGR